MKNLQNDERSMELLLAQRQLYNDSKKANNIIVFFAVISALGSILMFYIQEVATVFVVFGFFVAVSTSFLLDPFKKHKREKAARIQEELDCYLFNLPWNQQLAGDKISPEDISDAAKRFKGNVEDLKNWYNSAGAHPDKKMEILLCQRESISWDQRLRKQYANIMIAITISVILFGWIVATIQKELFLGYFLKYLIPISGLLLLLFKSITGQRKTAEMQKEKEAELNNLLYHKDLDINSLTEEKLRSLQNFIFKYRFNNEPIPNFVYKRLKKRFDENAQIASEKFTNN